MKGITPVIALILLLVIVIVVVGFSFGIFQSIISSAGSAAETQATTTTTNIQQTVTIEAINPTAGSVSVRNQGADAIDFSDIGVYVNGVYVPTTSCGDGWTATGSIDIGGVGTCDYDATTYPCAATQQIRVTSPSGSADTETC